ncbi:carotenoid biosynthesis protein [Salinarchaeum chitinilyticum]
MTSSRSFGTMTALLGVAALVHALLTWPLDATVALFAGGAILAFVGELIVVKLGWLDHHVGPTVAGVPCYVLPGWTAVIYATVRIALLVTEGWAVVPIAAIFATAYDVLADNHGVAKGYWTYTDDLPGPRHGEVPWWNYAGWFVISACTAALTVTFL